MPGTILVDEGGEGTAIHKDNEVVIRWSFKHDSAYSSPEIYTLTIRWWNPDGSSVEKSFGFRWLTEGSEFALMYNDVTYYKVY